MIAIAQKYGNCKLKSSEIQNIYNIEFVAWVSDMNLYKSHFILAQNASFNNSYVLDINFAPQNSFHHLKHDLCLDTKSADTLQTAPRVSGTNPAQMF